MIMKKTMHEKLNDQITLLGNIVRKGVPHASRNKERRIRKVLTQMALLQDGPPTAWDVFFTFRRFLSHGAMVALRKISFWENTSTKKGGFHGQTEKTETGNRQA